MQKIIYALCLVFSLLIPFQTVCAFEGGNISAECYALMDAETGEILCQRGGDTRVYPASLTKIVTAIVALQSAEPGKRITVTSEAAGTEGSSVYLAVGEVLTLEQLLYAVLLESANDAAAAVAIGLCGSIEGFAGKMNEYVLSLGLKDTHFVNPHGLTDKEHYSTAKDMARILCHAMENEQFRAITSSFRYRLEGNEYCMARQFTNHNRLLQSLEGVVGGKTGYTRASGRCLATYCVRGGKALCAVTMNAPDDWHDHELLYAYGFTLYTVVALDTGNLPPLYVCGGNAPFVTAVDPEHTELTLKLGGGDILRRVYMRRFEFAPVNKGELIGYAVYFYGGNEIYRIPLYASKAVEIKKREGFWTGSWKR